MTRDIRRDIDLDSKTHGHGKKRDIDTFIRKRNMCLLVSDLLFVELLPGELE